MMLSKVIGGLTALIGFSIINGMPEDRTMVLWIPVGFTVFFCGLLLAFGGEKDENSGSL